MQLLFKNDCNNNVAELDWRFFFTRLVRHLGILSIQHGQIRRYCWQSRSLRCTIHSFITALPWNHSCLMRSVTTVIHALPKQAACIKFKWILCIHRVHRVQLYKVIVIISPTYMSIRPHCLFPNLKMWSDRWETVISQKNAEHLGVIHWAEDSASLCCVREKVRGCDWSDAARQKHRQWQTAPKAEADSRRGRGQSEAGTERWG